MRATALALGAAIAGPGAAETSSDLANRISLFRWQEDYSDLENVPRTGVAALKWQKVTPRLRLNVGGQYRLRLESVSNLSFGLPRSDVDFTSAVQRFLLHADLHDPGRWRAFFELGTFIEDGRAPGPRPIDRSELDVQQAFVDVHLPGDDALLRLGRQELVFGRPPTLLGLREGPNQRRAFDAVRIDLPAFGGMLSIFGGRPVLPREDAFADGNDDTETLIGTYLQMPLGRSGNQLDLYHLWRRDTDQVWPQDQGNERRHTLGFRLYGVAPTQHGRLDWDVEAGLQRGRFANFDIQAYAVSAEIGHTFEEASWRPRLHLRAAAFSGDDDPTDGKLGTFDALYPNLGYFSQATNIAPANLTDIEIGVSFSPSQALSLRAKADLLFRAKEQDAFYGPGNLALVPANIGGTGHAATLFEISATWTPRPGLAVSAAYVHGRVDGVIERAGGRDSNFLLLSIDAKF